MLTVNFAKGTFELSNYRILADGVLIKNDKITDQTMASGVSITLKGDETNIVVEVTDESGTTTAKSYKPAGTGTSAGGE